VDRDPAAGRHGGDQPDRNGPRRQLRDPAAGQIEIAYYASTYVVLPRGGPTPGSTEACWPTAGPRKGFASWYALRAAKTIGEKKVTGDVLTPALEKSRVPLNAWSAPGEDDATIQNAEYAASLELARRIGARAGPAGLTAVWQAIRSRRAPPTRPRTRPRPSRPAMPSRTGGSPRPAR